MIVGVSQSSKFNIDDVKAVQFDYIESDLQIIELNGLNSELLKKRLEKLDKSKSCIDPDEVVYLVITTCGSRSYDDLKAILSECTDTIKNVNIPIYIENGMKGSDAEGYTYNDFSEARDIRKIVDFANEITATKLFGTAINIGYANLLAKNVRMIIEDAGEDLKLVHVNDNDGFHNDKQMPYTFTRGRGDQTTDWERIIGAIIRIKYDGLMVFDTEGLFNRMPECIAGRMLNLLANIAMYWLSIITFEDVLDADKQIILFGAGRMASNFLYIWGDRYRPSFIVDNDEKRWGSTHRGYEIRSPEAILDIPEEDRIVLLCNMHYEEIGVQLRRMGIPYIKYNDNYYDFVPQ